MALFTVFLIGILWSVFDLIRKKSLNYFNEYEVLLVVILSQLVLFSFSLFFSDFVLDSHLYFIYYSPLVIMGLLGFSLFLKALKHSEISLTIPLLSFTPLFSSVYAFLILGEKMSETNYFGVIVIIIGSFILYSKSLHWREIFISPKVLLKNVHARLMLIVALIWSLTPVLDKKCLVYTDVYFHGFLQSIGWLVMLPFIIKKNKINFKSILKKHSRYIIISVAVVGASVSLMQLYALTYNLVPVLESFKRSIGIILSMAFGYFFFEEIINFKKAFSVVIIILGLNLLLS